MSSLFALLRSSTEQQHREIESLIDPMKNFSSLEVYKAHVLKSWTFYCPLEAELAHLDWTAVGIDFTSRRKTPLLEEDLRILGVPRPQPEENKQPLDWTNLDFALGCLYVLEGATLGGQMISRHLATLDIGPANGGLFFNGYGAKTGEMWKSFQASATAYCVTDDQIGEAVSGAKSTFGRFRESMLQQELISREP
jgi:heme oxygenase (biliverdin-IX-beta and delta-forming)